MAAPDPEDGGIFTHLSENARWIWPEERFTQAEIWTNGTPVFDAQKYEFSGHCAWVNKIGWPMCFSQGIAFFPLSLPSWRQPGDRCKDLSFVYVFLQMISQWPPVFLRSSDTVAGSWFVIRLGFTIIINHQAWEHIELDLKEPEDSEACCPFMWVVLVFSTLGGSVAKLRGCFAQWLEPRHPGYFRAKTQPWIHFMRRFCWFNCGKSTANSDP